MIRRPAFQNGNRTATGWPLQLNRFEANAPPDPADTIDCLIILNDRTDGTPRARVVVSNGASYDTLAYTTDIVPQQAAQTILLPSQPSPPLALPYATPSHYNDAPLRAEITDLRHRVAELEQVIEMLRQWGAVKVKERV